MEAYDISLPVSPKTPVWPGDQPVDLKRIKSLEAGDEANVTHLSCNVHSGTHIDAPRHFVVDGKSVDQLQPELLVGPAWVCHFPERDVITADDLAAEHIPSNTQRLLLRTRNSKLWEHGVTEFRENFTAISTDAAEWIVAQGLKVIGIDYLSIQLYSDFPSVKTHTTLLGAGIVILEGLNLTNISTGRYQLICLPIKLVGSDGAPARALLIDDEAG